MDLDRTQIALRNFARKVQKGTKQRAQQRNVKATGEMIKQTSFKTKVSTNSIELIYERPKYSDFQDQGVSGTKKKYKTPFSYKNKKPPAHVFAKWAKVKGIKPRNSKTGKFMSFKAFGFIVANNVFQFGLKPRRHFTDTFIKEFNNLAIPIQKAYAEDAMDLLKTALK